MSTGRGSGGNETPCPFCHEVPREDLPVHIPENCPEYQPPEADIV